MLRRQLVFDTGVNDRQTTPRKWSTVSTIRTTPQNIVTGPQHWIGKKIVYWQGEALSSYVAQIRAMRAGEISEYEIAKFAKPHIYRIIFVDAHGNPRSKPSWDYSPNRLNILVDNRDVIKNTLYF